MLYLVDYLLLNNDYVILNYHLFYMERKASDNGRMSMDDNFILRYAH